MFLIRHLIILSSFSIVLSNAVRCTINCTYNFHISKPFYIPTNCNEMNSAGQCQVNIGIDYDTEQVMITFSSDSSNYIMKDRSFLIIQLDYNSLLLSHNHECKKNDDCAREYAINNAANILQRPIINSQSILSELKPLLLSNSPTFNDNYDLICYDSNENIRQCSLGKNTGECQMIENLIDKKKTTRTCEQDTSTLKKFVSVYDSGHFALLTIQGNRSLCNGAMTSKIVKDILFRYNATINKNGRLRNNTRQLSVSFIVILISLFHGKMII